MLVSFNGLPLLVLDDIPFLEEHVPSDRADDDTGYLQPILLPVRSCSAALQVKYAIKHLTVSDRCSRCGRAARSEHQLFQGRCSYLSVREGCKEQSCKAQHQLNLSPVNSGKLALSTVSRLDKQSYCLSGWE